MSVAEDLHVGTVVGVAALGVVVSLSVLHAHGELVGLVSLGGTVVALMATHASLCRLRNI